MSTVINEQLNKVSSSTSINETLNSMILPIGCKIDKYTILDYIYTDSGEANVYLCERDLRKMVAKVYKRTESVKEEVLKKLDNITSPYVTKIIEAFLYEGYLVEILPYYENGSLENKTYSFEVLKNKIIPALNEGLHALHKNTIVHKDLKPSNIMLTGDDNMVSIIDFGISSVLNDGVSMIITRTGVTFDYAAPEMFPPRYNCWYGVDYYSLGLVIYKLYYGKLPFQDVTDVESRERYFISQKIPFPGSIPQELKDLIEGLTYLDIRNQKDPNNPNRRWTYKEVVNWCKGITQIVPGSGTYVSTNVFGPITFKGNTYTDKKNYILALLKDWEFGKKKLFRGGLSSMFSKMDDDMWKICEHAEKNVDFENEDVLFLKTMLKLESSINQIYWNDACYESIIDLGTRFLNELQHGIANMKSMINVMLDNGFFSSYLIIKNENNPKEVNALKAIENSYKVNKSNPQREHFMLAYVLSEHKNFYLNGVTFDSVSQLEDYLQEQLRISVGAFENACREMIDVNGNLKIQFETWLIAHGKIDAINNWKKEVNK